MKSLRTHEHGVGHVAALLGLVVLAVVAFAGWKVMAGNKATDSTVQVSSTPATLKTKADVTKAANELDATGVDSTVNPDSLDNDLNNLL